MMTLIVGGKIVGYLSLAGVLSDETVKQHTGLSKSDVFSFPKFSNLVFAGITFVSTAGCIDLFPDTRTHVAKPSVLYLSSIP